jgi:iron transport multicopper oxidase
MQIVNRAIDYTSDDPSLNPPLVEGQTNPMRRDTVTVTGGGSATLRLVADNPGAWLFHCKSMNSLRGRRTLTLLPGHIEWHFESGLAVQFISAPLLIQERAQNRVPSFMYDQCAALGIASSGNAAGHASPTDLSGLPLGPWPQKLGWLLKGILAMTG